MDLRPAGCPSFQGALTRLWSFRLGAVPDDILSPASGQLPRAGVDFKREGEVDTNLQAILDKAQIAFLGSDPSNEQISAWFGACLNSACGPVGSKYGNVAVWALLTTWVATVEEKMTPEERGG